MSHLLYLKSKVRFSADFLHSQESSDRVLNFFLTLVEVSYEGHHLHFKLSYQQAVERVHEFYEIVLSDCGGDEREEQLVREVYAVIKTLMKGKEFKRALSVFKLSLPAVLAANKRDVIVTVPFFALEKSILYGLLHSHLDAYFDFLENIFPVVKEIREEAQQILAEEPDEPCGSQNFIFSFKSNSLFISSHSLDR